MHSCNQSIYIHTHTYTCTHTQSYLGAVALVLGAIPALRQSTSRSGARCCSSEANVRTEASDVRSHTIGSPPPACDVYIFIRMCVYIYMYVYVCVYIYKYMYTYIYIDIDIYVYIYTYM